MQLVSCQSMRAVVKHKVSRKMLPSLADPACSCKHKVVQYLHTESTSYSKTLSLQCSVLHKKFAGTDCLQGLLLLHFKNEPAAASTAAELFLNVVESHLVDHYLYHRLRQVCNVVKAQGILIRQPILQLQLFVPPFAPGF